MDDIVVIILTIVIAVVGALSQRKKRQQMEAAKKNPGSPSKQPMDIWEILREQSTAKHPFDEEDEPDVESWEEKPVDTVPEAKPTYQFVAKNEGRSDIKETIKEEPKRKHRVLIDGEKFSLRKAVIYSEIMNRKYT